MRDAEFCGECGANTRGECTCSEECETCGGDGEVFEDRADRHGEHYTVQVECPDCHGAGRLDDEGPMFEPGEIDPPLPTEDTSGLKDPPL